ncbi:hypothetical protein PC129_g15872 [Phytophthora cactorum]|nr:hypothetical protein PC112_g17335 [Phytophthora cactorum]KAG2809168.1 hypothetical protein PC111_g16169 [Phytophthora cactorum]KAG2849676.1 hypothetical protein PC113_g17352 [Phytophthora cactorum]KAG2887117.1 hypothetical protein PC114_g18945 [Phytophthora cactorum]KAG2898688.1 hypothetical protein PC115_g16767 [Phytophthora cactorum]
MNTILGRKITPERLRKHLKVLVNKQEKQMTKEQALSGREPKKTADQVELEDFITRYIELKEDEDATKPERIEIRNAKAEADHVGGEAIRDVALKCEKPKMPNKSSGKKRLDLFEFLKSLTKDYEARKATENRERLDHEERMQKRAVAFQEEQLQSQQQVNQMMTIAMQALPKVLSTTDANSAASSASTTGANTSSGNPNSTENSIENKP